jgi:multisubunit Na+/H+ antiporter MnhC subunit
MTYIIKAAIYFPAIMVVMLNGEVIRSSMVLDLFSSAISLMVIRGVRRIKTVPMLLKRPVKMIFVGLKPEISSPLPAS